MNSSSGPTLQSKESQGPETMRAIARSEYGSAEVLRLETVNKPVISDHEVLVRVYATSINAGDRYLMRGTPFFIRFLFGGLRKPKIKILGCDVAGRVESVGKHVTQFQPGDEVFGDLSACGFGAFAEYVCATESSLALKPENLSFEAAATVPGAALAALQGLRDCGQLQAGQRVLINGASSGVGSFAIQIAKVFEAEVTAVCHTEKIEKVRSLGADHIIDYMQTDITQAGKLYDVVFDAAAYRSIPDSLKIVRPGGIYVLVGGSASAFLKMMLLGAWWSRTSGRTVTYLDTKPNQADLLTLSEMLVTGQITPLIDQYYSLSEIPIAIRRLEQREVVGKVAIRV
jgi:NADPH:quinone reductase-like Zn-dependent oxidoreductase